MTFQTKCPTPPRDTGFRIFVRAAYPTKYNFAVANYNEVSSVRKLHMRGGRLLLFRSIVAIVWIISMIFAILAVLKAGFLIVTVICSLFYIALSIYNLYVFFQNRDILNTTRLLPVKVSELNGLDYEWINVPLHSLSPTGRLVDVNQSSLDRLRQEFIATNKSEISCMMYTKRYADIYPSFPKELLLHCLAFILAIVIGITMAVI
jgi:hypothetical protein